MRSIECVTALTLAAALGWTAPAAGQVRSEIELTRQQIQTERQALVAAGMELTDAEADAFWPVYRQYRAALAPVGDRQVRLITGYAERFGSLTDDDARPMIEELLDIQKERLEVLEDYLPRFMDVLPALKVARFYQLENKLDAVVNVDLALTIPILE